MTPIPQDNEGPLDLGGIRCTAADLKLIQDYRVYRDIEMVRIRRVCLRYGRVARHPVGQTILYSDPKRYVIENELFACQRSV